ncbi:MAG TPA: dephospho-CoA kinase [Thiothrix sp.]|nr:dephospho-CoA kinase [Thiothrix sp.]
MAQLLNVGMTGGIACGKSTVAQALQAKGVYLIDADKIAREIVQPQQAAWHAIIETFGEQYCLPSGELNRHKLGQYVFANPNALAQLEAITHPMIRQTIEQRMIQAQHNLPATPPYLLVDIPLLIEKNYQTLFDRILLIDCSADIQWQRLLQRPTMTEAKAQQILTAQTTRDKRFAFATDVLENNGTRSDLYQQIQTFHDTLCNLGLNKI